MNNKHFLFSFIILFIKVIFTFSKMNILTEEKTIQNNYKQISLKPEFPNVKNIGRFLIKNDITYLLQSGSALEFYLNAKSGEIVFEE